MKQIRSFFKKYWITVWLMIAVFSLTGIVVYAIYGESHNSVKRVIATGKKDTNQFSSNYLTSSVSKHAVNVNKGYTGTSNVEIDIRNYEKSNPSAVYPVAIDYTLSCVLMDKEGSVSLSAAQVSEILGTSVIQLYAPDYEENPVEFGAQLLTEVLNVTLTPSSDGSAVDTYQIIFPSDMIDEDISLRIVAAPKTHDKYPDLPISIGALFYVQSQNIVLTTGWSGAFNDLQSSAPSGYDGFNYIISGSGKANRTLSWDKTLLEPNRQEILELFGVDVTSEYSDSGNTRSISISLDSKDNSGRYDIQFYVVDDTAREQLNSMTWAELSRKVVLSTK